ncbi:MAG: hypothetical protein RL026_1030 [Pseudomonadota bacterium]|jgi:chemosensory pili system protein ChpC
MSGIADELYCLLVPLAEGRLLIPRGCVAEVIGYQTPADLTGVPPWLQGLVSWNGRHVPVVSFEGCLGGDLPPVTSRARLVILAAADPRIAAGNIALVSQGFPQLLRAAREVLRNDDSVRYPDEGPVVTRLQLLNETALVPDLPWIEARVAEVTAGLPR